MSRARARAREAREAERRAQRDKAARLRERRARVEALTPSLPKRRPPRYGAMPLRTRLGLTAGVVLVQFVGWQVLYGAAARLGLLLVSLAALPVVVTLFVPTTRTARLRSRS